MLADRVADHVERRTCADRLASDALLGLPRRDLGREEIVAGLFVAARADDAVLVAVVDDRRSAQQVQQAVAEVHSLQQFVTFCP